VASDSVAVGTTVETPNIRVPGEGRARPRIVKGRRTRTKYRKILYSDPSANAAGAFANLSPNSARLIRIQQRLYEAGYYDSNDVILYGRKSPSDVAALKRAMEDANINAQKWEDAADFRISLGYSGLTDSYSGGAGGGGRGRGGGGGVSPAGTINLTGVNDARELYNALSLKYTGKKADGSEFADAYAKLIAAQKKAPIKYEARKIGGKWYNVQVSDSVNAQSFLEQYIFNKTNFGTGDIGGVIGENFTATDTLSGDYGISLSLTERGNLAKGLTDGSMTINDVRKTLAERAKNTYKSLSANINEGVSTKDLVSNYISDMASTLEIDADKISIKDVEKAIAGDSTMSSSDWIAYLKKNDSRYQYTSTARSEAALFAANLASTFGFGQQ
jgi:hypothetical protein